MDARARALKGNTLDVLVERFDIDAQRWVGRSHREAPEVDGEVRFAATDALSVGAYVQVRITGNDGADLIGATVEQGRGGAAAAL
jgi:ribosomal protein S12 methylthiotransferase